MLHVGLDQPGRAAHSQPPLFTLEVGERPTASPLDREALRDVLEGLVARGELTVHQDGEPITDHQRVGPLLRNELEGRLTEFARNALLVD